MNFVKEKTKDFYLLDSRIENIFINEYMPAAPGEYVKVFIYGSMYAEHGLPMDNATMAKQLMLAESDVQEAWDYWEGMGAVKRRYTDADSSDMAYAIEFINLKELLYGKSVAREQQKQEESEISGGLRNNAIKEMYSQIEQILRRTLNSKEVTTGLTWVSEYGASPEVVLCAVKYSTEHGKTSFNYIGKVISEWVKAGINTVEQAEEHIQQLDEKYYRYRRVLKALGFTRNATEKEKELMDSWFNELGFSIDKVLEACTKTARISNPNFNYVNSVLENWKNDAEKKGGDVNSQQVVSQGTLNRYFDYLRKKAEEEAEGRKAEVYNTLPRIKEIDAQMAKLSFELSKALIQGNAEQEGKKIRNQVDELAEERAILLTENNYEMDYTDVKYKCEKCNDTGLTDLGERCSCIKQRTEEAELWIKSESLKK